MSKAERDARYRAKHREEIARRQHEAYLRDPTPWLRASRARTEEAHRFDEKAAGLMAEHEFLAELDDWEPVDERELLDGEEAMDLVDDEEWFEEEPLRDDVLDEEEGLDGDEL